MNKNTMKVMLVVTIILAVLTIVVTTIKNKGNYNVIKQINNNYEIHNKK